MNSNFIGKGYGRRLLETVLDELKKQSYQEVFLWVLEENAHARYFYETCDLRAKGMKFIWEPQELPLGKLAALEDPNGVKIVVLTLE